MNHQQHSYKLLFNTVNISNPLNTIINRESEKNKTNPSFINRPLSSNKKQKIISGIEPTKNIKSLNISNSINLMNSLNLKQSKPNSTKKEKKLNLLLKNKYEYGNGYATSTTQTSATKNKFKKSQLFALNTFRNKCSSINIKRNYLRPKTHGLFSNMKFDNKNFYSYKNIKNNICLNSNINKTISNVIVDNNNDLLKELKNQTVNNFNNKYKLKYKTKFPKIHNKIIDVFSLLKKYKYEEEKKIDAIKTLENEIPKTIKKKKKSIKDSNEKDFKKFFLLIENDFENFKSNILDNKKFISIQTLDLLKK